MAWLLSAPNGPVIASATIGGSGGAGGCPKFSDFATTDAFGWYTNDVTAASEICS